MLRRAAILFLVVYPLALCLFIYAYPERYQRVDLDYHFTLNAFMNHGTPDIRSDDLKGEWMEWIWNSHPDPWYCLAKNENGDVYGHHFWLWPLLCLPLAKLFSMIGVQPLLSQSVTMGILLWLSLCVAWRYAKADDASRFFFIVMAGISPALFYLWVFGGEGFMYIMTVFAVTAASRGRFDIAAACVATASLQNTSMLPFAGCLAFFHIMRSERKPAAFAAACLSLCPALISPIFYLVTFGYTSALADIKPLSLTSFSLRLFMMEFFDWNGGLALVIPIGVLLFLASIPREAARIAKTPSGERLGAVFSANTAAILGCVILPFSSSIWYEWNTAYLGVMRWSLPVVPLVAWLASTYRPRIAAPATLLSTILMIFWIGVYGWGPEWMRQRDCYAWSAPAKAVLKYIPSLCVAWNDESMYERSLLRPYGFRERDGGSSRLSPDLPVYPIVYSDPEWGPRKIMTTPDAWRDFRSAFQFENYEIFGFIDDYLKSADKRALMFNMPAFKPSGKVRPKIVEPSELGYSISSDLPATLRLGEPTSFTIEIKNSSELPLMPHLIDMPSDTAMLIVFGTASDDTPTRRVSDLLTIDSFPLPNSIASGGTISITASIVPPSTGKFYFKAMLGQVSTFFTSRDAHDWLCVPIEVKR